jgi:hypothetical protein
VKTCCCHLKRNVSGAARQSIRQFLAALVFSFTIASPAFADFYTHFWENQLGLAKTYRLESRVIGLTTPANFSAAGASFVPVSLNRYVRAQAELLFAYSFTNWATVYARTNGAYVWTQSAAGASAFTVGFGDQSIGATFRAMESKPFSLFSAKGSRGVALDLQVQADLAAYDNAVQTAASQPVLGDGSFDFTGGLFLTLPLAQRPSWRIMSRFGAGFTFRTGNYSTAVPWSARFSWEPVLRGFTAHAGLDGVITLASDPRGPAFAASAIDTGALGSYIAQAANTSMLNIRGSIGYRFSRTWALEAEGGATLWGQNAAQVYYGGLLARFYFGESSPEAEMERLAAPPERNVAPEFLRSNRGFIAYTGSAKVLRVNDRINSVRIDKGSQDGVEVGQVFDIFKTGTEEQPGSAIARSKVIEAGPQESTLQVLEYFQETWIENGMTARRPLD